MAFKIFAVAFASFAFGFNLCNVIPMFFSPYSKCDNSHRKAAGTDKKSEGSTLG